MNETEVIKKLSEPFPAEAIDWRVGAVNSSQTQGIALAYLQARPVMERLDQVLGPENWMDTYQPILGPQGPVGFLCTLSVRLNNEWIAKVDGADTSDIESIKGGLSDAFKRAAVKWGVGRYLYDLPTVWAPVEPRGKSFVLKQKPNLPAWALPKSDLSSVAPVPSLGNPVPETVPDAVEEPEFPSFDKTYADVTRSTNELLGFGSEEEDNPPQALPNEDDYSALSIIKDQITKIARGYKYAATEKQAKLAGILTRGFWPEEEVRHAILNDLFGYQMTLEDAKTVEVAAFLNWLRAEAHVTPGPNGKNKYSYTFPAEVETLLTLVYEEYKQS